MQLSCSESHCKITPFPSTYSCQSSHSIAAATPLAASTQTQLRTQLKLLQWTRDTNMNSHLH